jgi:isoleucyl-tRNA synthetase
VLTHGFALDQNGRKMSKSIGNVIDPLVIIRDNGADILRLWVASTDFFEDVRIGKEVLAGTSDAYRKLRNTFRYLLGALAEFTEEEQVPPSQMPELERWVLHRLAELDAELKAAANDFEFNRYARLLTTFANEDLSAFFFDIRKDSLYCDAPTELKRRAYRTVLDIVFHALIRWVSPILCFTAEEVWSSRYPDAESVHLETWPEIDADWRDDALAARWARLREYRSQVLAKIEPMRREKIIGSGLEVDVKATAYQLETVRLLESANFSELAIAAGFQVGLPSDWDFASDSARETVQVVPPTFSVTRTLFEKCGRCWRHLPEVNEEGALCARCEEVVNG